MSARHKRFSFQSTEGWFHLERNLKKMKFQGNSNIVYWMLLSTKISTLNYEFSFWSQVTISFHEIKNNVNLDADFANHIDLIENWGRYIVFCFVFIVILIEIIVILKNNFCSLEQALISTYEWHLLHCISFFQYFFYTRTHFQWIT